MFRLVKRWPIATALILLHATALLATITLVYTSHTEAGFNWVYGVLASYPSSILVQFLKGGGEAAFAATLLLIGTLQWGIIGVAIDAIIHRFRREATPHI